MLQRGARRESGGAERPGGRLAAVRINFVWLPPSQLILARWLGTRVVPHTFGRLRSLRHRALPTALFGACRLGGKLGELRDLAGPEFRSKPIAEL